MAEARSREEQDSMLRLAVEASPAGMILVRADEGGTIVIFNKTSETIFGYSRSEVVG